ncbi:mannitol dehydrogenase family protein [Glaciecola sp. SC05]|uniref:mannitol dehydrogenase family protein n=1 Tax=Glaciecola sp. SC05 TaxID=1987355 RepID=UPI00352776D3
MSGAKDTRLSMAYAANKPLALSLGCCDDNDSNNKRLGIVHIGIGAFHRAHQAWYTQNAMLKSGGDWRITGVSLRSETVAQQLNPQDGLYTLVEQNADSSSHTLISVVDKVLVAPQDPQRVLQQLCDKSTRIVSLTITEKGYCHDGASGGLNLSHPDIQHDLQNLASPRSALGFLVSAMQQRISERLAPFTVMSCDNLPNNGQLLRHLVLAFAEQVSPTLATNIQQQYSFPSSMVDRIVPAVTDEVVSDWAKTLGYSDQALVLTECFSQWVIEDDFVNGRPDWEGVGALLVSNVHVFETMKLRLLNGSHSAIAYLGYLGGLKTVAEVMRLPSYQMFIRGLMHDEIIPSLEVPPGMDLTVYCEQLIARFLNPHLHHQTYQIAMDGSQKLPQRLLNPLRSQLAGAGGINRIAVIIAAWIQYTSGVGLNGEQITVKDPLSTELAGLAIQHQHDVGTWVKEVFQLQAVFDESLSQNILCIALVTRYLSALREIKQPLALIETLDA